MFRQNHSAWVSFAPAHIRARAPARTYARARARARDAAADRSISHMRLWYSLSATGWWTQQLEDSTVQGTQYERFCQFYVARAVAQLYHHEWSVAETGLLVHAAQAETLADGCALIADAILRGFWVSRGIDPDSRSAQERSLYHGALGPGICGPSEIDGCEGWLFHRTGTGRVAVSIYAQSTVVDVWRPEGLAFAVEIDRLGAITRLDSYPEIGIYDRHVYALSEAVCAVAGAYNVLVQSGDDLFYAQNADDAQYLSDAWANAYVDDDDE